MQRANYNTPLTYEERKKIEILIKSGLSCGKIAQVINRSKNAIVVEVRRNGKDEYNAKQAQKDADLRNDNKIRKVSSFNTGKKHPASNLKTRIESLEMQVQILHKALNQLRDQSINE